MPKKKSNKNKPRKKSSSSKSKKKIKKKSRKKTSKSKKTKKTTKKKIKKTKIKNAKPNNHFVLNDGKHIRNLLELADAMDEMTDEIFFHHVTDFKNDFAAWTSEVIEDEELSERLSNIKTRHKHQVEILKHLVKRLIK